MSRYMIWGMGLLGTSLARDLKKRNHEVLGVEKSSEYRQSLNSAGFHEIYSPDETLIFEKIKTCDGVIICTPVDQIISILDLISGNGLPEKIWITDMASTKYELMQKAAVYKGKISFIGSHPMAGSDLSGPENAKDNLFQGATIFITPAESGAGCEPELVTKVSGFWESLGAHPSVIPASVHDKWAAYLSHGLHLVSCMVSCLLDDIPEVYDAGHSPAGGSFRDITRVAGSNPVLWDGIIKSNSREVTLYLESLEKLVHDWKEKLGNGTLSVKEIFEKSGKIRSNIVKSKERNHGNDRV